MAEGRDFDIGPLKDSQSKYHDRYDNSYAVVIGIDSYKDPRLLPLGNAVEDAKNIADVLSGSPYNFQVDLLLNDEAKRRDITRTLSRVARDSKDDDRIIFFFAGHGYVLLDRNGQEVGYIACADTDPDDLFDGLELNRVINFRRFADAKHIAFILDSCYSGTVLGLTRTGLHPKIAQQSLRHKSYQVLTAGGVEAVSDARSLTGELVKVLRNGIPGYAGALTFDAAGQYIRTLIRNQSDGFQTPFCSYLPGSGTGEMVLMTSKPIDKLPEDLRQDLTDENPRLRLRAISDVEKLLRDSRLGPTVQDILREVRVADMNPAVRMRADEVLRSSPQIPQSESKSPSSPSLKPSISIKVYSEPETANVYDEVVWNATLQNDGDCNLRKVSATWGKNKYELPFTLNQGDYANISLDPVTYSSSGRKSRTISVSARSKEGTVVSDKARGYLLVKPADNPKTGKQEVSTNDPILKILPPPFEWCDIPPGQVNLEDNAGTFEVQPFKMAKYPITYSQFQIFIDDPQGFRNDTWWKGLARHSKKPGYQSWKIDNHPRENVSWYEAVVFCRWLSSKVNYQVRLPTEWEWQWAAQGPDGRRYPWGNEYIQGYANVDEVGSKIKGGVNLEKTTPVGNYPQGASPFGVLDLVGNVWERCLNEFREPNRIDTTGSALRVLRGGSWDSDVNLSRSAYRDDYPVSRGPDIGFRVVGFPPE